jgi:peptidoglycan/xylan/chitin deacetylase (PgdA/CDA1 family)
MISSVQKLVRVTDSLIARAYLSMFRERNSLMSFLFHSLFRDEQEIARNLVDPLQRTTVAQFRRFVEYYLNHGYRFIGPGELLEGVDPEGKYAMITFDDGYYNNTLALPILEEYKVPALFFVSTDNVLQNKCYWWDVLYRERIAQGATARQAYADGVAMKTKTTEQIEAELEARFGPDSSVHLGNHTANHAILTNYSPEQVRAQILGAQESLRQMTGLTPTVIAYPNGAHSGRVIEVCGEIGLKLGFTVQPRKNLLPLDVNSPEVFSLGRFTPHGESEIEGQCRTYRSDVLLYGAMRTAYLKLLRRQVPQSA